MSEAADNLHGIDALSVEERKFFDFIIAGNNPTESARVAQG